MKEESDFDDRLIQEKLDALDAEDTCLACGRIACDSPECVPTVVVARPLVDVDKVRCAWCGAFESKLMMVGLRDPEKRYRVFFHEDCLEAVATDEKKQLELDV